MFAPEVVIDVAVKDAVAGTPHVNAVVVNTPLAEKELVPPEQIVCTWNSYFVLADNPDKFKVAAVAARFVHAADELKTLYLTLYPAEPETGLQ